MKFALIIVSSFFLSTAYASSCCVANAGLPQFMTLPAKWQITTTASQARVIGDTSTKGRSVFRGSNNREKTTQLGGGIAWAKGPWQLNASFAYAQKERQLGDKTAASTGATDPSFAVVREIPTGRFGHRVWSFVRHIFPAADSVYDTQDELSTNSIGAGRPQTGLGALYMWNARYFDAQALAEAHLGHANQRGDTRLGSQPGGSMGAGVGWVKSKWRLGSLITARWEASSTVKQEGRETRTGRIQVWDSTLSLGRQIDAFQNAALSYNDQTLLGPARNTTLSRSFSLLWQWRW